MVSILEILLIFWMLVRLFLNWFFSKKKINHEIFNVCSNNPKKLTDIIKKINFLTQKKPKLLKRKLQQADVVKTHGTNKKIKRFIGKQKFYIYRLWFKNYC